MVFLLVLNIPLFLYGLKKQGVTFTIYAIYTVAVYSFGAWLITDKMVMAAKQGADSTREMEAVKGRASYREDKSVGYLDPGAVTMAMQLECMAECFANCNYN